MSYDLIFEAAKKLSEVEIRLTSAAVKDYAIALGGEFLFSGEAFTGNATRLGTMVFLDEPWKDDNMEIFKSMFSLLRLYQVELYDPQLSRPIDTS